MRNFMVSLDERLYGLLGWGTLYSSLYGLLEWGTLWSAWKRDSIVCLYEELYGQPGRGTLWSAWTRDSTSMVCLKEGLYCLLVWGTLWSVWIRDYMVCYFLGEGLYGHWSAWNRDSMSMLCLGEGLFSLIYTISLDERLYGLLGLGTSWAAWMRDHGQLEGPWKRDYMVSSDNGLYEQQLEWESKDNSDDSPLKTACVMRMEKAKHIAALAEEQAFIMYGIDSSVSFFGLEG